MSWFLTRASAIASIVATVTGFGCVDITAAGTGGSSRQLYRGLHTNWRINNACNKALAKWKLKRTPSPQLPLVCREKGFCTGKQLRCPD
ncbi:hypothetical protein ACRALDRAFT_213700 [Sodiomyces alcalophilus JCM 7366]|uniref:uncharacterized protein n=1 Tax=Sodiomyces alcalophilus JCM 7366 TaxID=591952 RepID=UPI0039B61EE3